MNTAASSQTKKLTGIFLICFCCFCICSLFGEIKEGSSTAACPSLAAIKERGKLIVGTYNDDPYFAFMNDKTSQLEGFDIDMAHAIAQELLGDPEKVEFVIVSPPYRIFNLQEGKVDLIIAEMTITPDRVKQADFSDVYYIAGKSILVNTSSPYKSLGDLRSKTVGVLAGSNNSAFVKRNLPNSDYAFFNNMTDGFQALREGRIQALCMDDVLLSANRDQKFLKEFRFIGGEISMEGYGIAMQKGCSELLQVVNKALKKIKEDGRWQKIYDKNIGDVTKVSAKPPK